MPERIVPDRSGTGRSSGPTSDEERANAHDAATTAFVTTVRAADVPGLTALYVFGSVARGEAEGLSSDVELRTVNELLQEIAYEVMLEYDPVVEIHLLGERECQARAERREPFVTNVLAEARQYV